MKYINTNDLKEPIDWNRKISSNKALTKKVKSIGFKVKEFGDDGIKQVNQELKIYEDSNDIQSGISGFSISDNHGGIFSIDYMTGDVSLDIAPDYEDETLALNEDADGKFFTFTVTVEDSAGNSADQSVKLYVRDVAELPPVFKDGSDVEISAADLNIDENNDSSVVVYSANAVANPIVAFDTGSDSVVYSLADEMSSDFYIDSMTGEVSL